MFLLTSAAFVGQEQISRVAGIRLQTAAEREALTASLEQEGHFARNRIATLITSVGENGYRACFV